MSPHDLPPMETVALDDFTRKQLAYWTRHLSGSKALELRSDYFRPAELSGAVERALFSLDEALTASVREFAAVNDASLRVVLLAAFRSAISRVSGEDSGAIGTMDADRKFRDHFKDTQAINIPVSPQSTFNDLIIETRKLIDASLENSDISFAQVIQHLAQQHDSSRNALVQLMFSLQDLSEIAIDKFDENVNSLLVESEHMSARLDLSLHLFARENALRGYLIYQRDLFFPSTIETFSDVYQRVIKAVIRNPSVPLAQLRLTTAADLEKLTVWNNTSLASPGLHLSLGDRFRQVATQHGTSIAVVDGTVSLTYSMLDEQSDRLASWIVQQAHLSAESIIGVFMGRSALLVVAYLGILKAHMAYMPLDKSLPLKRMRQILQTAHCKLVFSAGSTPLSEDVLTVDLASERHILLSTPIVALPVVPPASLSNIMFTSGSTGVPKGAMMEHRGMVNLCAPETTNWTKKKKHGLITTIGFDPAGQQIFTTLLGGSELHCLPDNGVFDVEELQRFIVDLGLQRLTLTPSVLGALLDTPGDWLSRSSIEHIALTGEKLIVSQVVDCYRRLPRLTFTSEYGAVECSVFSTDYDIDCSRLESRMCRIPVSGRGLPNNRIYVVDEIFSPVPPGVVGQIVLAGVNLGRGYLNRPDLTAERFIQTPTGSLLGDQRLYCTGDLGYWTSDGIVQCVGRMDTQVKIRGQRLEVEEVETVLTDHPAVDSSAVAVVPTPQGDQLIAYIRLIASRQEDAKSVLAVLSTIKQSLRNTLPVYMVPNQIFRVDALPLNNNGKMDRKLMGSWDYMDSLAQNFAVDGMNPKLTRPLENEQSLTADEAAAVDIFARYLGMPSHTIGLRDNLFDIGGHSLIAARIITAIRQHFRVSFGVALFYNNATPAGVIANLAQCQSEENYSSPTYLPWLDTVDLCPASDAQTRLWVEEQMYPGLSRYHVGFQQKLTGPLDVEAFTRALLVLLDRHEALRTVFQMHDPILMQRVIPLDQCPSVRFVDLPPSSPSVSSSHLLDTEREARSFLTEEHARPFDLAKDIPTRIVIVKISTTIHFVSLVIHHIATDGWSSGIIDRDLTHLYNSYSAGVEPTLEPLPLRYRDYSVWQRNQVQEGVLQAQLEYWTRQLQGAKPLELRGDYFRSQTLSGQTKEIPITIGETSVSALRRLAAKHRTSLYVVILAAFRATIFRVTGEDDGIVGMANAKRPQTELESIVGFFVNIHAIRLAVDHQSSFEDLIIEARKVTTAALDNSEIPFDKVVAHLAPQRDLSRNALVQLLFILQDFSGVSDYGRGLQEITVEEIRNATNQADLSLHLYVEGQILKGFFIYETDLFFSSTIQTFSNLFERVIEAAAQNPVNALSTLPLATADDLKDLCIWNDTSKISTSLHLSIGDRWRQAATQHTSSIAVVDGTVSLTYSMLDEQSDRLASWMVGKGFPLESIIGLFIGRSALLVVATLACLKAGMAYMPLDKNLPLERMRLMVHEAGSPLIITMGHCPLSDDVLTVDLTQREEILLSTPIVTLPTVSSTNLSNVMFTSGSTGVPKGVMLEHRGMVNLCAPETTNWAKKEKNGLTTTVGFDPSGTQIFTTLLSGSELHCLPDNGTFDVEEFRNFIVTSGIQRCSLTSSVLGALMDTKEDWLSHSSLEHIALGGEKLAVSQITDCYRCLPSLEFASEYGPVEASIWSTYFVIDPSELDSRMCRIPIGRALPNTNVYVVDQTLSPVPAGVLGQIVLAGVNLARGYLNRPDLTAERFVQTPADSLLGPQRLYCTGDLGYWTSDGQLQFVGRMDSQAKIRGQRLEVEEIETVLKDHPAVESSAVAVVPTQHGDQLVAYVRLAGDAGLRESEVLSLWKHHYDRKELYRELDNDSAAPDVTIWLSMYTGQPIPVKEMQEWLEDTISQIPTSPSDHVVELGVGTGKIALNIIDRVSSVVGTDVSSNALQFLETHIERNGLSSKLSVLQGAAHELDRLPKRNYTLALMNSVAQYFPSIDYLTEIISKIIDIMPEGRVFIGDVRSYALIPLHNLERILATFDDDSSVNDIRQALQSYDEVQTELLISPSFFFELQLKFPKIVHVEIKPKYMTTRNELSRYRYSVILHIGARPTLIAPDTWVDCADMETPVPTLRTILNSCDGVLGASNIAIDDIKQINALFDTVHSPDATIESVSTLRQQKVDGASRVQSTPASLMNMAKEEGWRVVLDAAFQGRSGTHLRAIFTRGVDDFVGDFPIPKLVKPSHNTFSAGNVDVSHVLKGIEERLLDTLPSYMVPSRIIRVKKLPLNRSGKLDRKVLSSHEYLESHDVVTVSREEPATEMERRVQAVFARALNCQPDTVDIRKSFFILGGHSLMATLVIAAIRREMGVNLSIVDFFRHPTVKEIAALIPNEPPQSTSYKSKAESVGANATLVVNKNHPGPTLFMFPEATGFASVYSSAFKDIGHKIVAFGDECWGETPDMDESSISSVVSTLMHSLREHQPHGPYFLSGWSLGGYMALEAAIQLQAAGESVGLVMMFDSNLDPAPPSEPRDRWLPEYDPLLEIVDDKSSWLNQFTRASRMMSEYVSSQDAYTGRVVLVKAQKGNNSGDVNPDALNGWGDYLRDMEVVGVDATHRNMFDGVHGPQIGKIIRNALQEGASK